jgi:hypothetical protein
MTYRRTRSMNKKRKAAKDTGTYKYQPRWIRPLCETQINWPSFNVQTTVRLAFNQSGRDGNAYLIGQQRVQSMLQTLAKSRTIAVEICDNFASQLPVNIRNLLDPA